MAKTTPQEKNRQDQEQNQQQQGRPERNQDERNQLERNKDEKNQPERNQDQTRNRPSRDIMQSARREMSREMDNFMSPFLTMHRQMNMVMENMFSTMTDMWSTEVDKMMPKVRVWEDRDSFHLKTRLPLDNPDNIEVAINDNILTLRWHQDQREKNGPHQFFSSHDAYRTIMIPDNADPERAEAICENGSLEVIVPKREDAQDNIRSIPIRRSA